MDFTLPALTQESFSRWYNKQVPRTDNIDERIVLSRYQTQLFNKIQRPALSAIQPCNVFYYQRDRYKHILSQITRFQQSIRIFTQKIIFTLLQKHQHT